MCRQGNRRRYRHPPRGGRQCGVRLSQFGPRQSRRWGRPRRHRSIALHRCSSLRAASGPDGRTLDGLPTQRAAGRVLRIHGNRGSAKASAPMFRPHPEDPARYPGPHEPGWHARPLVVRRMPAKGEPGRLRATPQRPHPAPSRRSDKSSHQPGTSRECPTAARRPIPVRRAPPATCGFAVRPRRSRQPSAAPARVARRLSVRRNSPRQRQRRSLCLACHPPSASVRVTVLWRIISR